MNLVVPQSEVPTRDRAILLRYHEIALKGDNRSWFEERLAINSRKLIQRSVGKPSSLETTRQRGRVIVHTQWNDQVRTALSRVFGISSFSPMRAVPTRKEDLIQAAVEEFNTYVQTHGMPKSFRSLTRRSEKALSESSIDIDRMVGSAILEAFPGLKVDLDDPESVIGVEIRNETSYIWTEKIPGLGGLPVGVNGKVLTLISGGLDSPIAAIKALRRGTTTQYLHFYGAPFVGEEVLMKVEDLVRLVNRYQPDPQPLHVIPFGKIQERIALVTNPKMRTILYRRLMIRIGAELAKRMGAQALITGESIGQVASQTLENISTINEVASIPVLRPLITFDKDEIIKEAKKWGTFETSVRPAADCCTLFADRHPVIRATSSLIEEQESRFNWKEMIEEAINSVEIRKVY